MRFKLSVVGILSLGLFGLASCASGSNQATTESSPAASAPESSPIANSPAAEASAQTTAAASSHGGQGGQVIESGPYHLEFIPGAEANGTHLDFYLQKGDNHEAISDAKVTAQIQLPDGTQETLDLEYDAAGKHYTVLLPATAAGEYKVAVLSDIGGEKVNGRFTFTK
jgi:hypothetical protein